MKIEPTQQVEFCLVRDHWVPLAQKRNLAQDADTAQYRHSIIWHVFSMPCPPVPINATAHHAPKSHLKANNHYLPPPYMTWGGL